MRLEPVQLLTYRRARSVRGLPCVVPTISLAALLSNHRDSQQQKASWIVLEEIALIREALECKKPQRPLASASLLSLVSPAGCGTPWAKPASSRTCATHWPPVIRLHPSRPLLPPGARGTFSTPRPDPASGPTRALQRLSIGRKVEFQNHSWTGLYHRAPSTLRVPQALLAPAAPLLCFPLPLGLHTSRHLLALGLQLARPTPCSTRPGPVDSFIPLWMYSLSSIDLDPVCFCRCFVSSLSTGNIGLSLW